MATSEALIQSTTRHAVYVERLKSSEVNQFAAFLKEIDRSIRDRLGNKELTDFSRSRLEKLLVSVDRELGKIFDDHYDDLAGRLTDIAEYEAGFEARNLENAVPTFEAVIPAAAQVHAAVFSVPLSVRGPDGGKLLEPFIKDWSAVERKRMVGAVRQGYFEGQTTNQILQVVRGTRKNGYRDGLLSITNRNAEAIVRTSVQHVASTARMETFKANSDLVKGYRLVATLDGRTTPICRSLDGKVFEIGKGPVTPLHIRCRTAMTAELSDQYSYLKGSQTRASKDGPVDADETYYSWLKKQSADFQDDIIGKDRGKLFRDGGLSAERFAALNLDKNFKPLSLAEMKAREPLAFERAGL